MFCINLYSFSYPWVRATYPRLRFDQLITLCWCSLLPITLAFFFLVPSLLITFNSPPSLSNALAFIFFGPRLVEKSCDNNNLNQKQLQDIINLFLKNIKILNNNFIPTIKDCFDFSNDHNRLKFCNDLSNVSGIYMIKFKYDNRLFYIGRASNLNIRLRNHFLRLINYNNRLGLFINVVDWENLSVHILFTCNEEQLEVKELYYIKKYLPTLNRKFSSHYSNRVFRTLTQILALKQKHYRLEDSSLYQGESFNYSIWVYSLFTKKILSFNSIGEAFIHLKI